jgi:hypothetical protein
MDPAVAVALISAARQAVMMGMAFLEAAGKDETQIEAFLSETRVQFQNRPPEKLPDPAP